MGTKSRFFLLSAMILVIASSVYASVRTGTIVAAPVTVGDSVNTFPTAYEDEINGGYKVVKDSTERNAISTARRVIGMVCYVTTEATAYRLVGGTSNSNWVVDSSAAKGGGWIHGSGRVTLETITDNVGIGVSNPAGMLVVANSNGADPILSVSGNPNDSNDLIQLGDIDSVGSSQLLTINGANGSMSFMNGYVGIGRTNPTYALDILNNTAGNDIIRIANSGTGNASLLARNTNGAIVGSAFGSTTTKGFAGTTTNHNFILQANSNPALSIAPSGYVGIGTTNPTAATFEVVGTAKISDANNNTYIAGGSNPTGGGTNVAIGNHAFAVNSSGSNNAAIGNYALAANTSGYGNAAYGCGTLYSNQGGGYNSAIGFEALWGNTSGQYNTALGEEALKSNSTGSNNIGIGSGAGYQNNGDYNVFIGYEAGWGKTSLSNSLIIAKGSTPMIYGNFTNNRVGIGTTNPYGPLHVASAEGQSNLLVASNGDVGVGTVTPGYLVHVYDTSPGWAGKHALVAQSLGSAVGNGNGIGQSVGGVVGYAYNGYTYHFGVIGYRYGSDSVASGISGGVLGASESSDNPDRWAALGVKDSNGTHWAEYIHGSVYSQKYITSTSVTMLPGGNTTTVTADDSMIGVITVNVGGSSGSSYSGTIAVSNAHISSNSFLSVTINGTPATANTYSGGFSYTFYSTGTYTMKYLLVN